jgi:hypothetical protein
MGTFAALEQDQDGGFGAEAKKYLQELFKSNKSEHSEQQTLELWAYTYLDMRIIMRGETTHFG